MTRRIEVLSGVPMWMRHAKCRDVDNSMFFVSRGSRPTKAIELCSGCPVKTNCDAYADQHGVTDGVWGGKNKGKTTKKDTGGPDEEAE